MRLADALAGFERTPDWLADPVRGYSLAILAY